MNPRRLVCAAAGLLVALGAGATVARAAGSPIGTWNGENKHTYRWTALPGGGFAEYVLTSSRTTKNHCLVKANTLVYKYHPSATASTARTSSSGTRSARRAGRRASRRSRSS